ncbi:Calx-beta domain-containing protein [Sedimenticola selenatireducens]|uniref:Calx-beta domain-containing protein n=1 Tax=Sedimenticola selenatireducens TaxID=191960 RepID=UPI002AAA9478|nr:Calx-beta domain-containing protein [Sedimenticola selenatireducens]
MKRHLLTIAAAVSLACFSLPASAGSIDPTLQGIMSSIDAPDRLPVIIRFKDTVDIKTLRREARLLAKAMHPDNAKKERKARRQLKRKMLVTALKTAARNSRREVRQLLRSYGEKPALKLIWARNMVVANIPADLLEPVAELPGVESVTLDITLQGPGDGTPPVAPTFWNLPATGVEPIWATGNTGQDVVVASLDTGVDAAHPDLGPRWRGGANSWFDPHGQHATPADLNGHGTQVMGLIVGGGALGYQIGMAPGAQWIAAKIFDNNNQSILSAIHEAYQWILDPDGDAATDDAPDIVNNSWVLQSTINQCNQEFQPDIALLKEAEIAVVFSAGNYGPNADTSVSPANDPAAVSVGGVDQQLNIDVQSSRGAGACDGGIYPHLVAPGDGVLTADRVPIYYNVVSGTSFAVAHLAGAMAVLKSAFPDATVSQLETSLIDTSTDLGAVGPDDTFGYGMLNVAAAYTWLEDTLGTGSSDPGALAFSASAYSVDENVATLNVTVTRSGGSAGAVSVDYATSDGTAIAGQDYQATSGTLDFADGETSQSFSVVVLDDALYEGDESFSISLSNPQGGATLGALQSAQAVVLDDDPAPQPGTLALASGSYSVSEGGASIQFTVQRSAGSDGVVTVDYATADGSATAGSDYTASAGTLTLLDGQVSASFSVTILDDSEFEGDEEFGVTLSAPGGGATLGTPAGATTTIVDNDPPPGPVDNDGDGYAVDVDCNDANASIYPGAPETKHDGIDQDCNGYDLTIDVTRARFVSAQNKLVVWATSTLGNQAGLSMTIELASGGSVTKPLNWSAKKGRWQKTLKNFTSTYGAIPVAVSVTGVEGSENSAVQQR